VNQRPKEYHSWVKKFVCDILIVFLNKTKKKSGLVIFVNNFDTIFWQNAFCVFFNSHR
jgi:hypothetical protein